MNKMKFLVKQRNSLSKLKRPEQMLMQRERRKKQKHSRRLMKKQNKHIRSLQTNWTQEQNFLKKKKTSNNNSKKHITEIRKLMMRLMKNSTNWKDKEKRKNSTS